MKDSITQEHGMGCAVACVAFVLGVSYHQALQLFEYPNCAWTTGYYCKDIIKSFEKVARGYEYELFNIIRHANFLKTPGTIIFINEGSSYPAGHYLAQSKEELWMNPWINYPIITPAQSGFQATIPGKIGYIIFENS